MKNRNILLLLFSILSFAVNAQSVDIEDVWLKRKEKPGGVSEMGEMFDEKKSDMIVGYFDQKTTDSLVKQKKWFSNSSFCFIDSLEKQRRILDGILDINDDYNMAAVFEGHEINFINFSSVNIGCGKYDSCNIILNHAHLPLINVEHVRGCLILNDLYSSEIRINQCHLMLELNSYSKYISIIHSALNGVYYFNTPIIIAASKIAVFEADTINNHSFFDYLEDDSTSHSQYGKIVFDSTYFPININLTFKRSDSVIFQSCSLTADMK